MADSAYFRQALVAIEEKFLSEVLQLLRLLRQHEPKGFLFVEEKFLFTSDEIVLRPLKPPPRYVLRLKQLIFPFNQVPLLLDEVLFDCLAQGRQFSE